MTIGLHASASKKPRIMGRIVQSGLHVEHASGLQDTLRRRLDMGQAAAVETPLQTPQPSSSARRRSWAAVETPVTVGGTSLMQARAALLAKHEQVLVHIQMLLLRQLLGVTACYSAAAL